MITNPIALLYVLLLLSAKETTPQPTCFINYDLSSPCTALYADIIFVGRVVSLTSISEDGQGKVSQTEVDSLRGYMWGKAIVRVETLFKGKATGEVELAFRSRCWGDILRDRQYIFNVKQTSEGLTADQWSVDLDSLRQDDRQYFTKIMRDAIKGDRRPALLGRLFHYAEGFEPITGQPIPDITVVAEKDGVKYESRTNADGRYEFRDLPNGNYHVYPHWPESLRPADDDYYNIRRELPNEMVSADNRYLCGGRRDFVAWDNGVIAGRAEDADGSPVKFIPQEQVAALRQQGKGEDADGKPVKWLQARLVWLGDKNKRQSLPHPAAQVWSKKQEEFVFINLPAGHYQLEFVGGDLGTEREYLTYPIDLAPGQKMREIVVRLPLTNNK